MSRSCRRICREIYITVNKLSLGEYLGIVLRAVGAISAVIALIEWGSGFLSLILTGRGWNVGPVVKWLAPLNMLLIGASCLGVGALTYLVWEQPKLKLRREADYERNCMEKIKSKLEEEGIDTRPKFEMLLAELDGYLQKKQEETMQMWKNLASVLKTCIWVPLGFIAAQTVGWIYQGASFSVDAMKWQEEMNEMIEFGEFCILFVIGFGCMALAGAYVWTKLTQEVCFGDVRRQQAAREYLQEMRYKMGDELFAARPKKTVRRIRVRVCRKDAQGTRPCGADGKKTQAEQSAATV